ncbi:hypothetical protein LINPERPRIM_LOCUS29542 [Linum perenne]
MILSRRWSSSPMAAFSYGFVVSNSRHNRVFEVGPPPESIHRAASYRRSRRRPSLVRWISLHASIATAAGPGLVRRCFYLEDKKIEEEEEEERQQQLQAAAPEIKRRG